MNIGMSKAMKPNGVRVYISWKEYEAIHSVLSDLETNCEGADDDYVEGCQGNIKALYNLIRKFKNAKYNKDNK